MKMKTFIADTMVEAVDQMKQELGEDAYVIESEMIRTGGFLGMFQKNRVKIVAGLDDVAHRPASSRSASTFSQENEVVVERLTSEVSEMKKMIETMHVHEKRSKYPDVLHSQYESLRSRGFSDELAGVVCDAVYGLIKRRDVIEDYEVVELIGEQLFMRYEHLPFGNVSEEKKYIQVVGPTGVGKTTTLAKIAARFVLEKKKKVAFMTTDTYRIGAIEQLKTYAHLLQAPVHVIYSKEDFLRAKEALASYDHVFIDTAGRNYRNKQYVEELVQLIERDEELVTYGVVSLTGKIEDIEAAVDALKPLQLKQFVLTKLDETLSYGTIFHLLDTYEKGIVYCTDGQEVPEDLYEPTLNELIHLAIGSEVKADES
ncbi:flagellar biosynthesis protein FlhF [Planococcaceae bacterium Storch 2/2-2]|nr:flagellar biosynthesis protein FlhF [Planococcaceae bacterium Storch 2/2-2]